MTQDSIIEFDIRGTLFKTTVSTMKSIDGSFLAELDVLSAPFFFDRDPMLFRHILNAQSENEVHVPKDVCPVIFKKEMKFWKIPLKLVAPCCWKTLHEAEHDKNTLAMIVRDSNKYNAYNKVDAITESVKQTFFKNGDETNLRVKAGLGEVTARSKSQLCSKLWLFLEEPGSSTAAKIWLFVYIFMVIVSVVVYIIWVEPSVRVPYYLAEETDFVKALKNNPNVSASAVQEFGEKLVLLATTDPHQVLLIIDMFCVTFFMLETIIHFIVSPSKIRYFLNLFHIFKIVLCIFMAITACLEFRKNIFYQSQDLGKFYHGCKSISVLRLLLIFRLRKVYNYFNILLMALRQSMKELALLLLSFLITITVYGCLIYSAEIDTSAFPNVQISMWWSLITMTTIGYGDFYPVSWKGYMIGVFCAINGIIVLALPIAAIASVFNDLFSKSADFQTHLNEIRKEEEINMEQQPVRRKPTADNVKIQDLDE